MSLEEYGANRGVGDVSDPGLSIAAPGSGVLPRLDRETLCDALRRLPPEELETALRLKQVPLVALPGLRLLAACGEPALKDAIAKELKVVAYAGAQDLIAAARAVHGRHLLAEATLGLARRRPEVSASRRFSSGQIGWALSLLALAVASWAAMPFGVWWSIISTLSGLFFLSVVALRVLCLMAPLPSTLIRSDPIPDEALPVYSVLVPLFRETSVLKQLLGALNNLDYPALCRKRTKTA